MTYEEELQARLSPKNFTVEVSGTTATISANVRYSDLLYDEVQIEDDV